MATKKTTSLESQLEIKLAKAPQKTSKSSTSANASLKQTPSSSCCNPSATNTSVQLKPDLHKLELSSHLPSLEKNSCCKGAANSETADQLAHKHATPVPPTPRNELKKCTRTHVVVNYDVGYNNTVAIRGKGPGLSWDKGITLKNTKHDEWIWETDSQFNTCEFKVLINDTHYEIGENHPISCGACIKYTPKF
jgi:hypothetical protein